MEYISDFFYNVVYFYLGKAIFGKKFVEDRSNIPIWQRFAVGLLCLIAAVAVVIGFVELYQVIKKAYIF